ncbi:hypothetical protein [Salinisphaera orenii]|uniref:hypothetical protein n=1 Tax=Salinisphaera orenii TaxID=856731 RepID=UPI000DBE8ECE
MPKQTEPSLENAASALAQDEPLSLAAIREYKSLLQTRRVELLNQLVGIYDPENPQTADRWQTTCATGSDAEIEALRDEHNAAESELERVEARKAEFWRLEPKAKRREAERDLPGQIDKLDKAMKKAEKAKQALVDATAELEAEFDKASALTNSAENRKQPDDQLVDRLKQADSTLAHTPSGKLFHPQTNVNWKLGHQPSETKQPAKSPTGDGVPATVDVTESVVDTTS